MATLATLRTAVSSKVGLDNTASSAEQSLMDSWFNQALVDILIKTRCKVGVATIALTAGQYLYTLDASILLINESFVTSGSSSTSLLLSSPEEIIRFQTASASSSPPTRLALEGSDTLLVWPTPASADTLTVHYVPYPATLSAVSDDPSTSTFGIPKFLHKAIEYYALKEAADYDDDSTSQMGTLYEQRYMGEIVQARKLLNRKLGRRYGLPIPGRRRPPIGTPSQQGV